MRFLFISFLLLFIVPVIYSQDDKILDSELNSFTARCRDIGNFVLNKESILNISNWSENLALGKAESYFLQLKSDIKPNNDITYHIILLKEDAPIFYTINFYDKNTLEEFGQLFITFKDRKNTLIDNINYISKREQAKSKSNIETLENIPVPPKPPKIKN